MYVKELKLVNFKSFAGDSNIFHFSPHVNYFVGNNNAGKTTVLEALNYICNGPERSSSPEDYMALSSLHDNSVSDGQQVEYYVEITLAGNIKQCIERSNLSPSQKTNLKNHLSQHKNDGDNSNEEYLRARRPLGDKKDSKHILLQDPKTGDFTNTTGIDGAFQNIFSPILFKATDTPDGILDFSPNKMLGKIMAIQTEKFTQSDIWKEFQAAHQKAFLGKGGYESFLHSLESQLSELTSQQFDGSDRIKISFSFDNPDATTFIKMGKTKVNDGVEQTDIEQKGNGLQRAVALAVIRLYARMLASKKQGKEYSDSLFLCIDEPEIWMHPKAQEQLAQALSIIGKTEQVFVTTHSPYVLSEYKKDNRLFILHDLKSATMPFSKRVIESNELGNLYPHGHPSLAEITYRAFQIATPEFHNELFGLLQNKTGYDRIESKNDSDGCSVDAWLRDFISRKYSEEDFSKYSRERFKHRVVSKCGKPIQSISKMVHNTLPVYIRMEIDHPEANAYLDDAIKSEQNEQCRKEFEQFSTRLKNNPRGYSDEDLENSIEILLSALKEIMTRKNSDQVTD